jgi:hypothetical protein
MNIHWIGELSDLILAFPERGNTLEKLLITGSMGNVGSKLEGRFWDLTNAIEELGYKPVDDANLY